MFRTYPFQYHDTGIPTWAAKATLSPGRDTIEFESYDCTGSRDPSTEACLKCRSIPNSREFKNLLRFASNDPTPDTPLIQLSCAQVMERIRQLDEEMLCMRLEVECFSLCDAARVDV